MIHDMMAYGVSWNEPRRVRFVAAVVAAVFAAVTAVTALPARATAANEASAHIDVLVGQLPGAGDAPEAAVKALGGKFKRNLEIIDGFVVSVPEAKLDHLRQAKGVRFAVPDLKIKFHDLEPVLDADLDTETTSTVSSTTTSAVSLPGHLSNVNAAVGASALHAAGIDGTGVGVAVIDTGVAPVPGMVDPSRLVLGPDVSAERDTALANLDGYGHGTHMAGIIGGRDDAIGFKGVAPGARVVSVKASDKTGATSLGEIIAAIGWVVQHKNLGGINIRVLNLSFGANAGSYLTDPLAYAAEQAWKNGIVVVTSAGNSGDTKKMLDTAALDPYVIAVGADDFAGTADPSDDKVPSWSNPGTKERRPELVAPGKSIVSLRVPGSVIDAAHPEARVGDNFLKGTGTSQATAVASGAAALLLQKHPGLTPDQVKAALARNDVAVPNLGGGTGLVNAAAAASADIVPLDSVRQTHQASTGLTGVDLTTSWTGGSWTGGSWTGGSWTGGSWTGGSWTGIGG